LGTINAFKAGLECGTAIEGLGFIASQDGPDKESYSLLALFLLNVRDYFWG
jgi:hypothetical protein